MDEETSERVQQGRIASLIRGDALAYIEDQRSTAILRLIRDYRSGTLTSEKCWGLVGEMSALETLLSSLDRDIKMGQDGGPAGREIPD